jgi:regulator of protease activity HflC (stomatin/prohibitin superfamily)
MTVLTPDLREEQTEPWGIKVSTVEVKDVELPADMQRAIARQAEAERERRAKVIAADGEFQAADKLGQAADIISQNPATLQLRYLQTLIEMGGNENQTVVFPIPMEFMRAFGQMGGMLEPPDRPDPRDRPSAPGEVPPPPEGPPPPEVPPPPDAIEE